MSRSDERKEMLRLGLSALSKDILSGSSFSDALLKLLENMLQIYQADGACLRLDGLRPPGHIRLAIGCCRCEGDRFRWQARTASRVLVDIKHRKSTIGHLGLGKRGRADFFTKTHTAELQTFLGYLGPLFDNVQARDQALAGMANGVLHDFNNVLQTLTSGLALLKTLSRQEALRPVIETMGRAAHHGKEVVDEIRGFLGENLDTTEELLLDELLLDVLQVADAKARSMPGKQISFQHRLAAPAPVHASRTQMKRIMLNLLFNAIDAIHETGIITVESRNEQGTASIMIADTGSGIPPDVVPRIFEPFFSTKGPFHTGLGLSSTYGMIKRYGGTIEVNSTPGKGTTFIVSLPTAGRLASPS